MLSQDVKDIETLEKEFKNNNKLLSLDVKTKKQLIEKDCYLEVFAKDPMWNIRIKVAKKGYALDSLWEDEVFSVRRAVANNENTPEDILEKLAKDQNSEVRKAIASRGLFLDYFLRDKESEIRTILAKKSFALDILSKDKCSRVRKAVAEANDPFVVNKLANDRDWRVRAAVASKGNSIDLLAHDPVWQVRKAAAEALMDDFDLAKAHNREIKLLLNDEEKKVSLILKDSHLSKYISDQEARRNNTVKKTPPENNCIKIKKVLFCFVNRLRK